MKYRAVIFDLDGVICHTDQYHYLAWKKVADSLGIYFDEMINNRLRGISRMKSLDIILTTYPGDLTKDMKQYYSEKKNEYYRKLLQNMSPGDLSEEVYDTLDQIKSKGLKIAIGSSSKNAHFILEQLELVKTFHAISDGNNITHSKPHPEVFLKASEYLNIPPPLCLVVEDALSGIQAAVAANMDCAALGDGTKYKLATYDLVHFSDLLFIV
ncbi:MAG: beta-phosphoglucomutase [Eubacteriales bacterium]